MCSEHPQKELNLFCVQCVKQICHLCAGISHRGCALVVTLEEAAEDRRVELQTKRQRMNEILVQSRDEVDSVKKQLQRLNILKEECTADIKSYAEALITVIKTQEAELLSELDEKYQLLADRVEMKIDKFREQQKVFHRALVRLTNLVQQGGANEILDKSLIFTEESSLSVSSLSSVTNQLKGVDVKFNPIASVKKMKNTLRLGEVTLEQTNPGNKEVKVKQKVKPQVPPRTASPRDDHRVTFCANKTGSVHFSRTRSQTISCSQSSRKPTHIRTISCKHKDDEHPPKLVDILVLTKSNGGPQDSVVLVTDWNNQCVKTFYSRRDRDGRLHLGGKPWCITALSESTVAVSLPLSQRICVLKISNSMMLLSSVIAEKRYSGLAAIDRHTLVASGGSNPPSVDIISVHGEVLKSLSHDSSGSPLFTYPAYVCSTSSGHILVSDRDAGTLTCLDRDGTVTWCFHPQGTRELKSPAGVFCDSQGQVLFVESRGVLGLTSRGEYLGAMLRSEDGVDNPRGVWSGGDGLVYLTQREQEVAVFSLNHSKAK